MPNSKTAPGEGSRSDVVSRQEKQRNTTSGRRSFQHQSYPHSPGFKDDGTGKEAAIQYAPQAKTRRGQVLAALAEGPATAEEIGARIGLHWYLTRPRLSELKRLGLVVTTGGRGRGALGGGVNQWRLTTEQERIDFAVANAGGAE